MKLKIHKNNLLCIMAKVELKIKSLFNELNLEY